MRFEIIYAIIRKDWTDVFRSKQISLSVILFPLIMTLFLPATMILPLAFAPEIVEDPDYESFSVYFLSINEEMNSWNELQKVTFFMIVICVMMFLLVPIIIPSFIAADAIAGEKERNTFEGLILAPVTPSELVMAKTLSSLVPTLIITWFSAFCFICLVDLSTVNIFGKWILPDLPFLLIICLLVPVLSFISTQFVILFSIRCANTRDAQQLSGLVIIPLVILAMGQYFIFYVYPILGLAIIIVLTIAAVVLFKFLVLVFEPEAIIKRI